MAIIKSKTLRGGVTANLYYLIDQAALSRTTGDLHLVVLGYADKAARDAVTAAREDIIVKTQSVRDAQTAFAELSVAPTTPLSEEQLLDRQVAADKAHVAFKRAQIALRGAASSLDGEQYQPADTIGPIGIPREVAKTLLTEQGQIDMAKLYAFVKANVLAGGEDA